MTQDSQSDEVPDIDRTTVHPSEPTTDGDNPNEMGSRQLEALKKNITKYGFLDPIILNRDNVVADGEHRIRAAKELGLEKIPAVVVDVDDADRRVIRQVMNKLKGDHDIHQDATEFQQILETKPQDDFADLLGQSSKSVDGVLSLLDDPDDSSETPLTTHDDTDTNSDSSTPSSPDSSDSFDDSGSSEDLGSPDALDPDTMEFDHECPECGYQW